MDQCDLTVQIQGATKDKLDEVSSQNQKWRNSKDFIAWKNTPSKLQVQMQEKQQEGTLAKLKICKGIKNKKMNEAEQYSEDKEESLSKFLSDLHSGCQLLVFLSPYHCNHLHHITLRSLF